MLFIYLRPSSEFPSLSKKLQTSNPPNCKNKKSVIGRRKCVVFYDTMKKQKVYANFWVKKRTTHIQKKSEPKQLSDDVFPHRLGRMPLLLDNRKINLTYKQHLLILFYTNYVFIRQKT